MANMLTIGDVYQPLNPLAVAQALEGIQSSRTRNRLAEMELAEKTRTLTGDKQFMADLGAYLSGPGERQPQTAPPGFVGPMPAKTIPPTANWGQMPTDVRGKLWQASPEKSWSLMQAGQTRADAERKFKLQTLKSLGEKAVANGDDNAMQQVVAGLASEGINIPSITITGKNEWETVIPVQSGKGPDGQPVVDPMSGQPVADGQYKVKGRGIGQSRQIVSLVPAKDTGLGSGAEIELTPEAMEVAANNYFNIGQLPAMGLGGAGAYQTRIKILNRAGEIAKEAGLTGAEAAAKRALFKANQAALQDNTKRETAVRQFTNTIDANIGTWDELQAKYGNNFGKIVNQARNMLAQGVQGSGDLASLQAVLQSTANEVAKVESGSLGIAEVSVEQARKWGKIFNEALDPAEMRKVMATSMTLGQNRVKAIADENERLKKLLRRSPKETEANPAERDLGAPSGQPTEPPADGAAPQWQTATSPTTGQRVYSDDGGETWRDIETGKVVK